MFTGIVRETGEIVEKKEDPGFTDMCFWLDHCSRRRSEGVRDPAVTPNLQRRQRGGDGQHDVRFPQLSEQR